MNKKSVGILLFEGFEVLDVYGPIEMLGMYPDRYEIFGIAESLAPVASAQGPRTVPDLNFSDNLKLDVIVVPGGIGTRREVDNQELLDWLGKAAGDCQSIASVCTGSALLARAGLLSNHRATTNKNAFDWVCDLASDVHWVPQARWVIDGRYYTSSGVSAGIDMTLALIAEDLGVDAAEQAANWAEYIWIRDPGHDPFAKLAGLT